MAPHQLQLLCDFSFYFRSIWGSVLPPIPEFGLEFRSDYAQFYKSAYIRGFSNEGKESIKLMAIESSRAPPQDPLSFL
ncbi:hypothetical protein LguiA_006802 [Lonicera macranthoides]